MIMNGARIIDIVSESPADDAGFTAGCVVTHVDGEPIRDIIDWQWLTTEDEIEVSYVDTDGDSGSVVLLRDMGEPWGFRFDGTIFDKVRICRNSCTFCFMRQLPPGMRATLSMRDDDFRMSFLDGTFVTLTNLTDEDISRICEQHISPLRVSLHATRPDVRQSLIGRHAQHGLRCLQRLLDAGIEFDAQIVLVPGCNDGEVLDETLEWAWKNPGIRAVGIVPLGFTRYQESFSRSFDEPQDALRVIEQIAPYQQRALAQRGGVWVYAADEFYRNAYGTRILSELPDASVYGDFEMYEDGIGIIRSAVDDFAAAEREGIIAKCAKALADADVHVHYVTGEAMMPYIAQLFENSAVAGRLVPLPVKNEFFGGNVNVTGLLTGQDIANAIDVDSRTGVHSDIHPSVYLIPAVIFNADSRTLDDWTLDGIKEVLTPEVAQRVHVVSVNPIDYMQEIIQIVEGE